MIFVKNNWPIVLISIYFIYRFVKSYNFKKILPKLLSDGALIVDVRSASEFASGHAPNSINIPLNGLSTELSRIPKDKNIIVCCASGTRSAMAGSLLKRNGYTKIFNAGTWRNL